MVALYNNLLKYPYSHFNNDQRSSSPLSTAFSFLSLCFLTILWNEVFFCDGDGPDIAKQTKKKHRAWKCHVMESKCVCFTKSRSTVPQMRENINSVTCTSKWTREALAGSDH